MVSDSQSVSTRVARLQNVYIGLLYVYIGLLYAPTSLFFAKILSIFFFICTRTLCTNQPFISFLIYLSYMYRSLRFFVQIDLGLKRILFAYIETTVLICLQIDSKTAPNPNNMFSVSSIPTVILRKTSDPTQAKLEFQDGGRPNWKYFELCKEIQNCLF